MQYYAVLNLFNSSSNVPRLSTRNLSEAPSDDSSWRTSPEEALEYAYKMLQNVSNMLLSDMQRVVLMDFHECTGGGLELAQQLTVTTLKMTALINLAVSRDIKNERDANAMVGLNYYG